ncbi:MAG: hypothetical protein EBU66_08875 [Bacteroidetes bacterium]|nr:hypothetical protein [bacterium]NBP64757.1 hypothetical protein [Bacteroidota bacterium]
MMQPRWFNGEDIISNQQPIVVDDVCGYVLPHAGTEYTGDIIRHTLQFQPGDLDSIRRVYIYYYPANSRPDVTINGSSSSHIGSLDDDDDDRDDRIILSCISSNICHHELYVPFRTLLHYFRKWNVNTGGITFIPVNVRDVLIGRRGGGTRTFRPNRSSKRIQSMKKYRWHNGGSGGSGDFYIISADFSHHKPFQYAIPAENKAAHAIVTDSLSGAATSSVYLNEIDDVRTFQVFKQKHPGLSFQWIGRTRSPGESAVGYLSFLIRPVFRPSQSKIPIDGIFVTCYDAEMNARECLGKWFTKNGGWSRSAESGFISEVKRKAQTESRLTGGQGTQIPITRCVITYLFTERDPGFIRGWHSIQTNAIYLPDVLLEHAKEDGSWITPRDKEWNTRPSNVHRFQLTETLEKLDEKAGGHGRSTNSAITLYTTRVYVKKC